jgi:hypothetical protein
VLVPDGPSSDLEAQRIRFFRSDGNKQCGMTLHVLNSSAPHRTALQKQNKTKQNETQITKAST